MTHISTLFEATKTWSNPPDKRRVKTFLESNDKISAAHITIKCKTIEPGMILKH